ncbi:MAG: hypothetical protein ACRCYR_10720 [Phycicoccus sp.]
MPRYVALGYTSDVELAGSAQGALLTSIADSGRPHGVVVRLARMLHPTWTATTVRLVTEGDIARVELHGAPAVSTPLVLSAISVLDAVDLPHTRASAGSSARSHRGVVESRQVMPWAYHTD